MERRRSCFPNGMVPSGGYSLRLPTTVFSWWVGTLLCCPINSRDHLFFMWEGWKRSEAGGWRKILGTGRAQNSAQFGYFSALVPGSLHEHLPSSSDAGGPGAAALARTLSEAFGDNQTLRYT